MPLLIMHDVGWPYGRRDLYHAPETIPAEYRQPYARLRISPKQRTLLKEGGLNSSLDNALEEGGPRNGVLTALEDFLYKHDEPVKTVILPIYFGLAVVAEVSRLEHEAELAAFFERLEGREMQERLIGLADDLWLGTLVSQQGRIAAVRREAETGAAHYLELLKTALLNEQSVDDEVRAHYLAVCAKRGTEPNPDALRDPAS